ncbi:DEAD/DEAH box helicase [Clostridium sp. AM58-1XD]|uniref:DEAD/DEAH box helicase n=1 Tax=Clostridium sp. AM58-1XD TaxID=2292307 RepID=UPI000E5029C8|nr:DEAD/DEAH box helicase [Clostridium sp. AM58-1XD]RGY97950.1 ATP-dependent helicase [Clostridium sp. AM58-1XD]
MEKKRIDTNQFYKYSLSEEIVGALTLLGYTEPTKIQEEVIPAALEGKDIVAKSQTGTGKTAAFAIPICEKVRWEENLPQALVLEPTRELAVQVRDEIFYIGRKKRLKVPAVFGGFPIDKQIQTLRQKSHIVVGTPGRVMDHIRRDSLKLNQVEYLIIDEADLMLDMGFLEDVKQIISLLPSEKQVLLFSATLDKTIKDLVEEYMTDAVSFIHESETETAPEIRHAVYEVDADDKYDVFVDVLMQENPDSCMIFCGTREMVNVLYQKLKRDHILCGMIHGEMEQRDRLRTIDQFRTGQIRCLIATDVASRGVDFENMTHVINYDFPTGRETYVHRAGRTGRNGKSGRAISFVCPSDQNMRHQVEAYIGMNLPVERCPDKSELDTRAFWEHQKRKVKPKARKGAALNSAITRLSVGGGRKSKMRAVDIVGTICSIDTIKAEDIGIIDVRDSLTYVEILNGKGHVVLEALQDKPIKGKVRKVRITR